MNVFGCLGHIVFIERTERKEIKKKMCCILIFVEKQDTDYITQSFSDIKVRLKVKTIKTYLFHVNFEVNEVVCLLLEKCGPSQSFVNLFCII